MKLYDDYRSRWARLDTETIQKAVRWEFYDYDEAEYVSTLLFFDAPKISNRYRFKLWLKAAEDQLAFRLQREALPELATYDS